MSKIRKQIEQLRKLSIKELEDERLSLQLDRLTIRSDLDEPGRVKEQPEWACRAKYNYTAKGIMIEQIDRLLREKKEEKNEYNETFIKIASEELTDSTYNRLCDETIKYLTDKEANESFLSNIGSGG